MISGWTNWRAVPTFASPKILDTTAIRPGRQTEAGFCSAGTKGIYQMNSNGAGGKELLLAWKTSEDGWPTSWSPDGRFILFVRGTSAGHDKMSGSCLSSATANPASLSKTPLMGNFLPTAAGCPIPPWNPARFRFTLCRSMPLRF